MRLRDKWEDDLNQYRRYNLEKITSESLVASINSNIKMLIQPAFDDGLANYFDLYPHFKFLCKKCVKEYLGF